MFKITITTFPLVANTWIVIQTDRAFYKSNKLCNYTKMLKGSAKSQLLVLACFFQTHSSHIDFSTPFNVSHSAFIHCMRVHERVHICWYAANNPHLFVLRCNGLHKSHHILLRDLPPGLSRPLPSSSSLVSPFAAFLPPLLRILSLFSFIYAFLSPLTASSPSFKAAV